MTHTTQRPAASGVTTTRTSPDPSAMRGLSSDPLVAEPATSGSASTCQTSPAPAQCAWTNAGQPSLIPTASCPRGPRNRAAIAPDAATTAAVTNPTTTPPQSMDEGYPRGSAS